MNNLKYFSFFPIVLIFCLQSCLAPKPQPVQKEEAPIQPIPEPEPEPTLPPEPPVAVPSAPAVKETRKGLWADAEFRAAWIATVANINWPSKPGLSTQQQQAEAIALLDFLQQHHFNAAIFQVRPATDALYQSDLEPWSYYLTGTQGKAPDPYYDPLEFWIEAAHDRGLELHVWLNPYRAHHTTGGPISEQSIVKKKPELVLKLKQGFYWMDPAHPGTQDHSYQVVMDLVKRYDLDGVHFDDYFYPYSSYNNEEDFPDDSTWAAYQKTGGTLARGDWRRQNVNQFIERVYSGIKQEKNHVKFGLSPFGIWRPGYPASIQGLDQYNQLYADAKLWLNKGWIDYFTPQLYWKINQMQQSFPVLLGWWQSENTLQRHLWPGLNIGADSSAVNLQEIKSQVMITRGMLPQSQGAVHWSISSLTKNPPMAKALLEGPYRKPALVPPTPWLDNTPPAAPELKTLLLGDSVKVSWVAEDEKDAFKWVVYYQYNSTWNYTILTRKDRELTLPLQLSPTGAPTGGKALAPRPTLVRVAVAAVDRTGNEGHRKEETLKR